MILSVGQPQDNTGAIQGPLTPDAESWYGIGLSEWAHQYGTTVRYIDEMDDEHHWWRYNSEKGVYESLAPTEMDRLVWSIFAMPIFPKGKTTQPLPQNTHNTNEFLRHLREQYFTRTKQWDAAQDILNCASGLLNLGVKPPTQTPHSPDYLSRFQAPVSYLGDCLCPTPHWDKIRVAYPEAIDKVERALRAAIYRDHTDEVFLVLVGPTGSGKGTVFQLIPLLFGSLVDNMSIYKLGQEPPGRGLATLPGKRILLNRDLVIGMIDPIALGEIKDIVTHEGPVHIDPKFCTPYDEDLDLWILLATNQLFSFPRNADQMAVFRRTVIAVFDKIMPRDDGFKQNVLLEANLIFTNLVNSARNPLLPPGMDIQAYANKMAELWEFWSRPIDRVMSLLFQPAPRPTFVYVDFAVILVSDKLAEERISMKEETIKAGVTVAMKRLKAEPLPKVSRGADIHRKYMGVRIVPKIARERYVTWIEEQGLWEDFKATYSGRVKSKSKQPEKDPNQKALPFEKGPAPIKPLEPPKTEPFYTVEKIPAPPVPSKVLTAMDVLHGMEAENKNKPVEIGAFKDFLGLEGTIEQDEIEELIHTLKKMGYIITPNDKLVKSVK